MAICQSVKTIQLYQKVPLRFQQLIILQVVGRKVKEKYLKLIFGFITMKMETKKVRENIHLEEKIAFGLILISMGINERAERLKHGSSIQQINDINIAVKRLTATGEMGKLFKVIGLTPKDSPTPPGFMT